MMTTITRSRSNNKIKRCAVKPKVDGNKSRSKNNRSIRSRSRSRSRSRYEQKKTLESKVMHLNNYFSLKSSGYAGTKKRNTEKSVKSLRQIKDVSLKQIESSPNNYVQNELDHNDFLGSLKLRPVFQKPECIASDVDDNADLCPLNENENEHKRECAKAKSNIGPPFPNLNILATSPLNINVESDRFCLKTRNPIDKKGFPISLDLKRKSQVHSSSNNNHQVLSGDEAEEKIIERVQQIEQSYKHKQKNCGKRKQKNDKEESTVIIFRDNNKKMKINLDGTPDDENKQDSLFDTLDAKRSGRKRRYAKLMKKLEDTGKSLETNFKGIIMEIEKDDSDIVMSTCMEKVKKKLCVRAKKKYESLINYQKIKTNVEQKSFEDLLPEKVDILKSNIVKEFVGEKAEGVVKAKKPRGRPRKIPLTDDVTDKDKAGHQEKKSKPKSTPEVRGFPRKFPRSLLLDSQSSTALKADKIRLGIIDKNGTKEVIELSNETFKAANVSSIEPSSSELMSQPMNSVLNENHAVSRVVEWNKSSAHVMEDMAVTSQIQNGSFNSQDSLESKCLKDLKAALGNDTIGETLLTSPPTTIRLPTISSLLSDYELVSLSLSHPKQIGDLSKDQFFIPQSTFTKDGKKGMVIVGPFCVSQSPKPHLILVAPKDHQKKEPMILKRKVGWPLKGASSGQSGLSNVIEPSVLGVEDEDKPCCDHNYCIPPSLRDAARWYAKKHDAMTRFIDARVESIEEGQGNSVVTIKGENILKQVKNLPQQAAIPISTTKDGIPVVYNLTQITTPVLLRAEERAKRDKMAQDSQKCGDFTQVFVPFEAMGEVVMEVLIPPCGTEIVPRTRNRHAKGHEDLNSNPSTCPSAQKQSFRVIGSMPAKSVSTALPAPQDGNQIMFPNDHKNFITINDNSGSFSSPRYQDFTVSESDMGARETVVPIENEVALEDSPGLSCCRLCLRLFPTAYALFSHVRSIHCSGTTQNSAYLEELKVRSKLACPLCRPAVYFFTPLKLERHIQLQHGVNQPKEVCSYCFAEFAHVEELVVHLQLSHGIYTVDNNPACSVPTSSKSKSHQTNSLKCKRSLLSDYLTCSRCNIMFDDRNSLVSHTLTVHPDLNQGNVCRLCEREFDTDSALHKHLRNSHEQTQSGALRCPYCPAWLANMDEASVHKVTVHSGAVPVHCPFCGAGYQSVHPMYNHVRSQHLLTESHQCPECHTSFPSARLLTDHARREHLISARAIKEHIRSVRSASYCCPFCAVSCSKTYDLAVHVVMQHKDPLLPAKCHFCMQAFVNSMIMKVHMVAAHAVHLDQPEDEREELSFLHHHGGLGGDDSVAVVLGTGEEDGYADPGSFSMTEKNLSYDMADMRHHHMMMDPRDVLETQEAVGYIQNLNDRDSETMVYLDDNDHVMDIPVGHDVSAGDMFDRCSEMSDGRLLDESLQAVDYLETLSNDRIAVAADVVADVIMDDIVSGDRRMAGEQVIQVDDMLGLNGQFEVDGVLYEFADAGQDSRTAMELQAEVDEININNNELEHFLH